MKKSSLIKFAAMLGLCAGSAVHGQVFNMNDVAQGFANNGYNYMFYSTGAANAGNDIWNGFDNPGGPGSTDSFGLGNNYTDPLTATPGNPYAHSANGYWAPDSGAATTPVLFDPSPGNVDNTSAGNSWSDGTLSPITVPILTRGLDNGTTLSVSDRTYPAWLFSIAAVVNAANPGVGTSNAPLGECVLSNVPAATYTLYLYGANYDGTRGASFSVSSGAPLAGISQTINPTGGPLNEFNIGDDFVVFTNVTPDATGQITIFWGAVSNTYTGLTGEGDFNGLQLVTGTTLPSFNPPDIVTQPQGVVAETGSNATFSVQASGYPPLTYQWYGPNGALTGVTNTSFTITNVQSGSVGSYYVVVTDGQSPPQQTTSDSVPLSIVTPLSGSYFSAVIGLDPLAYYPLNETNQPPAFQGYALNSGTLGAAGNAFYTGTIGYQQPGPLADTNPNDTNYSIYTDGSTAYAALPYSPPISNKPPFTVEAWLQAVTPSSETCALSCVQAASPRSGWLMYMDGTAPGLWNFRTYDENGTTISDGAGTGLSATNAVNISDTLFHHVVVVVNTNGNPSPNSAGIYPAGSITVTIYVDGVSNNASAPSDYAINQGGAFTIGGRSDVAFLFSGYESQVAYYTNALSATTISNHYSTGTNTSPSPSYYQTVLNTPEGKPMLYYQLDEGSPNYSAPNPVATNYGYGGSSIDGYYLPGTAPASVSGPSVAGFPATGTNNKAVAFNHIFANASPATGYVDVPFQSVLNIEGPISIAAWIKATPNDDRFESFLGHSDSSYRMDVDASMDVHFADDNGAGDLTGGSVNDSSWHFVVGTWSGTEEYLYIDGFLSASQSASGAVNPGSTDDFTIGVDPQYIASRMFDGDVSEVALFTYALSASQVQSLYYAADIAPYIVTEPLSSLVVPVGATTNISVTARGTPTLTYMWSSNNGASLLTGPAFSGTTTSNLIITSAALTNSGSFVVVVSNAFGSVTSSPIAFSVSAKPILTSLPTTSYAYYGTTLTLSVGESGSQPITNAWYANGAILSDGTLSSGAVISGSKTATLTISNIQSANSGSYTIYATNSFGTTSTSGAVVVDSEPNIRDPGIYTVVTSNTTVFGVNYFTPTVSNGVLQMTSATAENSYGDPDDATAFWFKQQYYVGAFQVHFVYNHSASGGVGGACFVIQNSGAGTNACGDIGSALGVDSWDGYSPMDQITNSFELEIDDNYTPSHLAIDTNGVAANDYGSGVVGPTGNDIASPEFTLGTFGNANQPSDIWLTYIGSTMTVAYSNEVTGATANYSTNVGPDFVQSAVGGSNTAYIGFTAGTWIVYIEGNTVYYGTPDTITISNASYTPIIPLSVTRTNGNGVVLNWPTAVGGYLLQSTTNLASKSWTTIPTPYTTNSSNMYQYISQPATGTEFYRLVTSP